MLSVPAFTASAQAILNGGGGGGGGTVTNPIANEMVVFASNVASPFALESAATTATLHQPFVITNPTATTPSFTIVDPSVTNTPQIKIVNAATAPTLGCSLGMDVQNNGSALFFNGDISSGTGYNPAAYRWGLVESNGTSLATSQLYIEYANGSTFTMAQSWTSSAINMSLPLTVAGTVTTPGVTLSTAATNPGGASTIWWTTPATRPNFGTNGPLALLSDVTGGGVVVATTTVSLTAPTTTPFTVAPPAGSTLTLTKYTVGTSAKVIGQFSSTLNLTVSPTPATALLQLLYPAGSIPAAFVPPTAQDAPVVTQQQGEPLTSIIGIGTDGSFGIQPAHFYDNVAADMNVIPWGNTANNLGGIYPCNFVYTFSN